MQREDETDREATSKLPPGAALSWGLVKPPQRGPKRELTIPQIVETAIAIADKDGIAAVSMARVAAALGFTAMSLYRYIPSKNDLLLLMQDAVCAIPIPPESEDGSWRDMMRAFVRASVNAFKEHPWYGDIPITGIPLTPNTLQIIDWSLRSMRDFPLNEYEKMSVVLLLSSYSRSVGLIERDMRLAIQAGSSPETFSGIDYGAALKSLVRPERFPYLHPLVMSGAYTSEPEAGSDAPDDFEFGLERILDGIQAYLDVRTPRAANTKQAHE